MTQHESADPAVATLLDMMAGHRVTAVVHAAVRLTIPEILEDGPQTAAEIATRTGAHEPSIGRLLRALVTLAICTQQGDRFELTPMGRRLSGRAPESLRPFALFE